MLTFTPVTQRDIARLRRYYKSCEYQLCEYSALVKLMWRSHLHPSWAEGAGCLIVRNFIDGQYCFDYPVPGPDGDEDAALTLIEDDCRERDIPLVLSVVPQDKAERLAARYPYFRFSSPRVWRDYIYAAEDLRDFAGRRYSGQRNHINKFRKLYPDAAFRPLGKSDLPLITQFFRDYEAVFTKASDSAKNELRCAEKMLRMTGSPHFLVGGMELDGRLLSVAMAERCGDTLQIHIEKALYGYEGVYPATVQAFAQEFAVDGVRWLNREDDAGDKGLRTSKLQYLPDHLGAKLRFDVLNELVNITEIPTLTTARRTLAPRTAAPVVHIVRRRFSQNQLRLRVLNDRRGHISLRDHAHVFHDGGQHLARQQGAVGHGKPVIRVNGHVVAGVQDGVPARFVGSFDGADQPALVNQHLKPSFYIRCGIGTGLSSLSALHTSASRISVQSQPQTSAAFSRAAKLEPCGTTTVPYFRLTTLAQPLACQRSRRARSVTDVSYLRAASRVTPRPRRSPYIPMFPWPP